MVYFLAFVAFIAAFAVVIWAVLRHLGRRLASRLESLHRDAQLILEERQLPPHWRQEARTRLNGAGPTDRARARHEARARRRIRRRLAALVRYFAAAPVFDDDDSRRTLIRGLQEAGRRWDGLPIESVLRNEAHRDDPS